MRRIEPNDYVWWKRAPDFWEIMRVEAIYGDTVTLVYADKRVDVPRANVRPIATAR